MPPVVAYSGEEYYYKVDNLLQASTLYLRKLFETRWKLETGDVWTNTPSQGIQYIAHQGQTSFQRASKFQKQLLAEGNVDKWDISTLSLALINFGNDPSKYQLENDAIREITGVRNKIAHHPTKKLTIDKYQSTVTIIKTSLVSLGFSEVAIDDIIDKAGQTSSKKAMEMLEKMQLIADEHMENGKFQEAINVLGEALTIPSLLPFHLSVVYETRASCYLKLVTGWQEVDLVCKQALTDVDAALELNDRSWNAHYIAAKCYRKRNKLSEAIKSYGRALAISPTQKHVMNKRDGCKVLAVLESSGDIFDPDQMPTNLNEEVKKFEKVTGRPITGEQYIEMFLHDKYPGSYEEFRGRMYESGWSVTQSLDDAFKCYLSSAKAGYPAGIFNTGSCYLFGRGVTQDVAKALEYYQQAANMSPDTPGQTTEVKKNFGVAASQHTLGVMYQCGNGVVQNYKTAVEWLEKAVENGFGNSASNLGVIYFEGNAQIPKNTKQAEMYWKQGMDLKSFTSALLLSQYYIRELEPDMALAAFKTSRVLGFEGNCAQIEAEFRNKFEQEIAERQQHDEEVEAFETLHDLDTKGLTFRERLTRKFKYEDPDFIQRMQMSQAVESHTTNWGRVNLKYAFDHCKLTNNSDALNALFASAANGSTIASRLVDTHLSSIELNIILGQDQPFDDEEKKAIVKLLYQCSIGDDDAKVIRDEYSNRLMSTIETLFTTECGPQSEGDMKIRFCYVAFNLQSSIVTNDTLGIELLKEGLKMYLDNRHYYILLIKWFMNKRAFTSALQIVDQGLKRFPKDFELLLAQATCMRIQNKEPMSRILEVYEQYLQQVPKDDRFRPDAYFDMAALYLDGAPGELQERTEMAKKYYDLGEKAEKNLLACFLPREKTPSQTILDICFQSDEMGLDRVSASLNNLQIRNDDNTSSLSIVKKHPYLMNPVRLRLIKEHRKKLLNMITEGFKTIVSIEPKLRQIAPSSMIHMKAIKLQEMVVLEDTIYENRFIDLKIIDDACFGLSSIHVLVEDSNGDVTVLCLFNETQDVNAVVKFGFGCRLTILNPYMRIGMIGQNAIRNDDVRCVIPLDGLDKMCRFCGNPGAKNQCGKCMNADYCGKECQELDWKQLEHNTVCGVKLLGY